MNADRDGDTEGWRGVVAQGAARLRGGRLHVRQDRNPLQQLLARQNRGLSNFHLAGGQEVVAGIRWGEVPAIPCQRGEYGNGEKQ